MSKPAACAAAMAVLALGMWSQAILADSAEATCEVRKDGETKRGASGPCTFSQRQGYVDLDLRNGDTYSLSPGGKPDHYKDQKGNKVIRSIGAGGEGTRPPEPPGTGLSRRRLSRGEQR